MMDWPHDNVLRRAEVLEVHPEANAITVRFLDDGTVLPGVPVMGANISTRSGTVDLPEIEVGADDNRDINDTEKLYAIAVIAMASTLPIAIGFLPPVVSEMQFKGKKNLRVQRHASDTTVITQDDGSIEVRHPSGAFVKIGASETPEDLTGQDFNGKWQTRRNTDKAVTITASSIGATATLRPNGEVDVVNASASVKMSAGGEIEAKTPGATLTMEPGGTIDARNPAGSMTIGQTGEVVARSPGSSLTLSPSGQATIAAAGLVTIAAAAGLRLSGSESGGVGTTVPGNLIFDVMGDVRIKASGSIDFEAGGDVTTKGASIIEDTGTHVTTGTHTDSGGGHCPTCP
jgi:hypothetical protein